MRPYILRTSCCARNTRCTTRYQHTPWTTQDPRHPDGVRDPFMKRTPGSKKATVSSYRWPTSAIVSFVINSSQFKSTAPQSRVEEACLLTLISFDVHSSQSPGRGNLWLTFISVLCFDAPPELTLHPRPLAPSFLRPKDKHLLHILLQWTSALASYTNSRLDLAS